MKLLLIFLSISANILAKNVQNKNQEITLNLNKDLETLCQIKNDETVNSNEYSNKKVVTGSITAVINEFADKLFKNLDKFAKKHNLDPVVLKNISQHYLAANVKLTNGKLSGISTLNRTSDVIISYSSSDKILNMFIPIRFSNLQFTYDYHIILLLIGPKGGITGKISNFKMNVKLQFDFKTYQAKVIHVKTTDSGLVSITFQGNPLDIVINILSQFAAIVLHPLISVVIEGIVNGVAGELVSSINDAANSILEQP